MGFHRYDPPCPVFAAKVLMNDIDLILIDPSNKIYYGNQGSNTTGYAIYDNQRRDELNTNEQIHLDSPQVGLWEVRIQAKQLLSFSTNTDAFHPNGDANEMKRGEYQTVSTVMTFDGIVSGEGLHHVTSPINSIFLDSCNLKNLSYANAAIDPYEGSSDLLMPIDISLYSIVKHSGWDATSRFKITQINESTVLPASVLNSTSTSTNHRSILTIYGSFNGKRLYDVSSHCLPKGCYTLLLDLKFKDGGSTTEGTQAGIPQCGIYVSPLVPTQNFCINPAFSQVPEYNYYLQSLIYQQQVRKYLEYNRKSHLVKSKTVQSSELRQTSKYVKKKSVNNYEDRIYKYPSDSCQSTCLLNEHVLIPVNLFEAYGEG